MAEYSFQNTTQTNMKGTVQEYSPPSETTDGVAEQTKETYWHNTDANIYYGYYKNIPEYRTAINAYATWIIGRGWNADTATTPILENITGWGEDSFLSILWNLIVTKKVVGDAFAEIILDKDGTLINLKPLDPYTISTVVDSKGVLLRYEQISKADKKAKPKIFQPYQILHLVNDRYADNIHGTSITESVRWIIDARNEAMRDWRRISHRSTIRIMYIDAEDTTRLTKVKTEYATAIKNGELMIIPNKKGDAEVEDLQLPPVNNFLDWIRYLEQIFYQALGIPKVILSASGLQEGDAKMSYLTFEQVYVREIEELKADLWNQLGLRVEFSRPVSLKEQAQETEIKNASQTGFQQNDTQAGVGE